MVINVPRIYKYHLDFLKGRKEYGWASVVNNLISDLSEDENWKPFRKWTHDEFKEYVQDDCRRNDLVMKFMHKKELEKGICKKLSWQGLKFESLSTESAKLRFKHYKDSVPNDQESAEPEADPTPFLQIKGSRRKSCHYEIVNPIEVIEDPSNDQNTKDTLINNCRQFMTDWKISYASKFDSIWNSSKPKAIEYGIYNTPDNSLMNVDESN